MDSSNGEQPNEKIRSDLSNSLSSKSAMSLSFLAHSDENFDSSHRRSHEDNADQQNVSKQAISLTASTSMPNLSELANEATPDSAFWQDLDMQLDFFDQDLIEKSPKKVIPEEGNVGVADDRFGTASTKKKRLPPKLISLDPQHFYQHADKPERSVPSGSSSSKATKSSSISSGSKMDVSLGSRSDSGFRNVNSMSIDSRDTMAELAQRIEPVGHDDIEFDPLDLTLSEELHLHLSSSYSMSVDERLVKYASTNTTPHSTMKTFDYPESFSMSSWSQHTISQDVFGHHKNGHQLEHVLEGDLWNAPSVELDLLDLHEGLAPPPTITANHSRHPAHANNNPHHSHLSHHGSHHSQHSSQHHNSHHNSHHAPSLAQQNYAQMHPPGPPVLKPSPGPRGPRPPTKGNKNKAGTERGSIGETAEESVAEDKSPKSPKSARKSTDSSPASLPVEMPGFSPHHSPLQGHISPRQSPQMPHQQMGVPAMYSFPTAFQQGHAAGLVIHTNSPASPLHNNATLSPTQYLNNAQLAPLYDPTTGVVYYPQIPPGVTLGQAPVGPDPTSAFFGQMQAAPGVSQRVAASFRLQASGFPVSSTGSPVSANAEGGTGFDNVSATMLHNGSGSTSNTVTPTGAQLKSKDKKDKNRGNYRCGRCGKPKVNHVCTFVDAVTVSQAVQARGVILNPHTMQPFNGDRVLTVNTQRKSIQVPEEDDTSFESFGMKAASGSFTLGSKTPVTAAGAAAMDSLSAKSGTTDLLYRSSSNLTGESLLARTNSNLTGESLLARTNSNGSDIFNSLSRSGDEAFSPRELNLGPRSPGSARPSIVFSQPINLSHNQPAASRDLAQAQLSSESDDVFFPTAYPPKTGVMSSRNSSINEAESDSSSVNGDTPVERTTDGAGSVTKVRSTFGSISEGLGKFFQF